MKVLLDQLWVESRWELTFSLGSLLEIAYHVHFPLILIIKFSLSLQNMFFVLLTHCSILIDHLSLNHSIVIIQLQTDLPIQFLDIIKRHIQFFEVSPLFLCKILSLFHAVFENSSDDWLMTVHCEIVLVLSYALLSCSCRSRYLILLVM